VSLISCRVFFFKLRRSRCLINFEILIRSVSWSSRSSLYRNFRSSPTNPEGMRVITYLNFQSSQTNPESMHRDKQTNKQKKLKKILPWRRCLCLQQTNLNYCVLLKTRGVPQCDLAIYILNKSILRQKKN